MTSEGPDDDVDVVLAPAGLASQGGTGEAVLLPGRRPDAAGAGVPGRPTAPP